MKTIKEQGWLRMEKINMDCKPLQDVQIMTKFC